MKKTKIYKNKKSRLTQKLQKGGLFITKSKINSLNSYFRTKYEDSNFLEWYEEREKSRTKYNYFTRRNIDSYRKLYETDLNKLENLKLAINYYEALFDKNNISQDELEEISIFFRKDFYQPINIPTTSYHPTIKLNHKIKTLLISQLMILDNEKVINNNTFKILYKKINKINNLFQNNLLIGKSSSSSKNSFSRSKSSNSSSRSNRSNKIPDNIPNEKVESLLFGTN